MNAMRCLVFPIFTPSLVREAFQTLRVQHVSIHVLPIPAQLWQEKGNNKASSDASLWEVIAAPTSEY